ncbi:sister chromatid cohesion protein PDS5 homolog B isoform X2 [Arachis stenosperma]|uniref:sister chromatid cohesion protein PDS5 homolog B isoform X2 n=1 Tax=Arachis stenosperma TaxID=217475 RepID=UPI0025AD3FDD|nr:sister chromatid cohesion protein PDS5 homolog B isoform X2 [Arachis stenosperma]
MDEPLLQRLSELGIQLAHRTRPNKDFIVKSLREAVNALCNLEQSPQPQNAKEAQAAQKRESALKPLVDALCRGLLRHPDKDVRLLVAICVTEIFRVKAPEPPFEDKYLREVFKLIVNSFADLADIASPYFSKRVKLLDTVAQLRCCVIMLEIDCVDLVLEMFNIFFSVVSDDSHDSLIYSMSSIMLNLLNESEEASQQLLEVILRNLIKGKKDATSAAYQLAASVIKSCAEEDALNSLVCRYLISCIHARDAMVSELKESYHEIIFKVFQCAPQMLVAVIPSLIEELLADQVDVRIKSVNLVGKLFALSEQLVAQKYHDLFVEFLERFSDKSVDVRISALQCSKAIYVAKPYGTESDEIISAVEDRLLDFDDRVRMQAVLVACDISRSNLKLVPSTLISQATERLRDKKISVRKRALKKMIEVYQDYCTECWKGSMTISDHFEKIPCKIMLLCYDKDCKEFGSQNMEFVFADDLFPENLPVEERTKHWMHMFSLFSSQHEKALLTILTQKRRLQNEMKNYLAMRKKLKGVGSEDLHKKIEDILAEMAESFPDCHKAKEGLRSLNLSKDNKLFKSIEQLLEKQTFIVRQANQDVLLGMIGDNHPYHEFLQSIFSRCSNNIFSSEHVQYILDFLLNNQSGNNHLEDSSVDLLLVIVRIFPTMLKGLEMQFQMLLEQKSTVNDKLIEIIAKAGAHVSFNISDIYPFLKKMCLDGTRTQAKFSVSAIAAITTEQSVFLNLYEALIDPLYSQWNVPTVLQSLGCIAQHSVLTFETRGEEITSYISQKIIQMEHLDDGDSVTCLANTARCCESCQLKIYGLKTLVKSYLPYQAGHIKRNIKFLLDILSTMLYNNFDMTDTGSCENDMSRIRLAAAKAVLRLSRKWDLHITPEIFRCTILIGKDSSPFVRRTFLAKIHKLLKERKLPIRFTCAFAFGVTDGIEDVRYHSYKYIAEFIKDYGLVTRKQQSSAAHGAVAHPAYMVVYLIHVLAQNSDFPLEGCRNEKLYADFCSPLFFVLQAFTNASIVDGDLDIVNDAVLHLFSIFRAIRKAEDAIDPQTTTKLHILAEFGMFALNAINRGAISVSQAPGQILLPSSFYKGNSKCSESFCEEGFLCSLFATLKRCTPQAFAQKPLTKLGRKGQEAFPKSNTKISRVLDLTASKMDNLSVRAITNAKSVRQDSPPRKRSKHVLSSNCGSTGLHESMEKQNKIATKNCEKTSGTNMLLPCDSMSGKGCQPELHLVSRRSKRAAACTLEIVPASCKHTVQHFKCPETHLKDSCGVKKQDILADVSNKKSFSQCDPIEHSSLSSLKETVVTTGGLTANEKGY